MEQILTNSFDQAFAMFTNAVFPGDVSPDMVAELRELSCLAAIPRHKAVKLVAANDNFVFLAVGATKLVAYGTTGGAQILSFQMPGDLVCVPGAAPHTYELRAVRTAEALVFDKAQVMDIAARHPAALHMLAQQALDALQNCQQQLVTVGRRSATERVAGFIMSLAQAQQAISSDDKMLSLVMTRMEIADCLGLTVETVSRQFTLLRTRNLIETPSTRMIRVPDWQRLADCAGHFPTSA